jgi:PKD repeat protein
MLMVGCGGDGGGGGTPEVIAPPEASFMATASIDNTMTWTFTSTSSGAISNYTWDFADGTPAMTGAEVVHTYSNPGDYDVMLTVAGEGGEGTAIEPISVEGPPFNPDPITLVTWEGTFNIDDIDDCTGVIPPNYDIELTFTQTGMGEGNISGTSSDTDVIGTWIATGDPDEYSVAMDLYYGGDLAIEYSTEVVDVGDGEINQCFEGTFVNDVLGQTDGLVCDFCIELVAN